ncbi:class I SAM-dependent methyltransferase [Streptomyces sp. OF3]|uniref:Class I SAM-dependent methyltransferase n=1 Tax=Streptomyces alkaliterrae TaxID=2213162 RepID=A0A7W3WK94_9ACTN|nr:class I SAM-dependent methyltransferase [Streptomyces alkaliterrae]MBB1253879.1 class I SAM-dependent methyltransferase [Streptomyces alkaliterrae]
MASVEESESGGGSRFYGELAHWWPLISPVAEYTEEAEFAAGLLESAEIPVREVLELGSGGGHNAFHLRARFDMTLVDLSDQMLEVSRRLNPGVPHVRGDMRHVRLGRLFDAVFVHDAIDYMTTRGDLLAAFRTAHAHLRPGGVAVFLPDHVAESFRPETDCGGSDADDGSGIRYLEWTWRPTDARDIARTEYTFTIRSADGGIHVVHETHEFGLFPTRDWRRLLIEAGFRVETAREPADTPRTAFVGHLPRV